MATTPEGKVKDKVRRLLKKYGPAVYQFWPVQTGYGAKTLDCLGWMNGKAFAVETKAPGKKLTAQQTQTAAYMRQAGSPVFVIDGDLSELHEWLDSRETEIIITNVTTGVSSNAKSNGV